MTQLGFLSPDPALAVSPLRHVEQNGFVDLSGLAKLEVRGDVSKLSEAGLVQFTPRRALLVFDGDTRPVQDRLTRAGYRVYDMTAALAALEVEGERLMRRLTDLDLDALPATGSIARGTRAIVERLQHDRFRIYVPQELGQFVAEVVNDMAEGLRG